MSNRKVRFPEVESFAHLTPDKWLLLKTLEEAAEMVEAGKQVVKAHDDAERIIAWADMADEWADVLQTLANVAAAFELSDERIARAMADCRERNRRRGRL